MQPMIDQLTSIIGGQLPTVIGALALLALGWVAALMLSGMTKSLIHRTTFDSRLAGFLFPGESTKAIDIQKWIGNTVFYVVILFVLMAVFQTLQLTQVNEPLNRLLTEIFQFLPRLMSALILFGVAWVLATLLRLGIKKGLTAVNFDERFQDQTQEIEGQNLPPLSGAVAETIYWLVFLLFLPAILGILALEGLLDPVQGMIDTLLGFLPNIFAAGLILGIGWLLARIVQRLVTNMLAGVGIDQIGQRAGLTNVLGHQTLSKVIGLIVYVVMFIPIIVGALNALALQAITDPASHMLDTMIGVLPDLFGAILMLTVAYIMARIVSTLASNVLASLGFNSLLVRMGIAPESEQEVSPPSRIAGQIILAAMMLFASIEAANILGFDLLANLISEFTIVAGHVILGLIVFGIGLYLANLAAQAVKASGARKATLLANGTRVAILVLTTAMALRQMGLADDIVNLAFGLTLGALAIALALALGLGGREIAATELKEWIQRVKGESGKSH